MLDSTEDRYSRLAKMAYLYHVVGKNQEEIATIMGVARPMISRQLKEAEKLGIVQIEVQYPSRSIKLEQEFKDHFNIEEPLIYIVDTEESQELKMLIGRAAANYLEKRVPSINRLAISWGSTLFEMIQQLKPLQTKDLEVIQLIGATGREHNPNDGPIIARNLAERLGAKLYLLHAPLIVDSIQVAKALLKDKVIRQTLDRAMEADLSLVGIGSLEPQRNSLYKAGYLNEEELEKIRRAGGVGDICAQFYDIQGKLLDIDINKRIIGLPLEKLREKSKVMAVSFGKDKVEGILGALRGNLIDGLITDHITAEAVLRLEN